MKLVVSWRRALVWTAFSLIGVDFAFIWAVLSFLFNFIPSIGSIVVGVTSSVFALVQFYPDCEPHSRGGISMLTIQLVLGNVIDPKLQGDSLKISPVVILFSLLFWGWLWGIVGLFLAVPLTVALKIVFENIPGRVCGVLMGRRVKSIEAQREKNGVKWKKNEFSPATVLPAGFTSGTTWALQNRVRLQDEYECFFPRRRPAHAHHAAGEGAHRGDHRERSADGATTTLPAGSTRQRA